MKNLVMKMKKNAGYIGIETMVIGGLVVAAGFVAIDQILMGSLQTQVTDTEGNLATAVTANVAYSPFI